MIRFRILLIACLATPLAAQRHPIAPAPSVLFRSAPVEPAQDADEVDGGLPQNEGAFFGFLLGAGAGYLISGLHLSNGDRTCSYVGSCDQVSDGGYGGRVVGTVVGAVAGLLIGSYLARPRAP